MGLRDIFGPNPGGAAALPPSGTPMVENMMTLDGVSSQGTVFASVCDEKQNQYFTRTIKNRCNSEIGRSLVN